HAPCTTPLRYATHVRSPPVGYNGRNLTTYGPSNTAPTNAGDYTASATFAGDANHAASSPASADFTISPAGSTTTVVCTGTPFTYDGKPHGCTATWADRKSDG